MEPWQDISTFGLVQFFMLIGLLGLVVPIYPGLVIMWLAALGYGILTGFDTLAIFIFIVLTLLMLGGSLVDNLLLGAGARKGGASWRTILVALAAGIIGTLLLPPIGGIIAAPVAILLLEYSRLRDWNKARQAVIGLATGWGLAYFVRLGVGILMMVLWWVWALNN
ncbi:MAG: DUF456 domain-containing protein [Chloroflexota bacterium]